VRGSALLQRLRAVEPHQYAAQVVVERDGRVARGVDTGGDAALDLTERDLVGDEHHRLQAGAARLRHVVRGRGGRERGGEHRLAGQVAVAAVLQHGAARDLPDGRAGQPETGGEPVERGGEHVLVGRLRVRAVRTGERKAVAADHGGLAHGSHVNPFTQR
jgi:hypothetical protein